jgi:hypothetical protein
VTEVRKSWTGWPDTKREVRKEGHGQLRDEPTPTMFDQDKPLYTTS